MKKILIVLFLLATPLFTFAASETCSNPNILAYYSPETMTTNDKIFFYVPSFVAISSFEASLNGVNYPVEYKRFGLLTRAKVRIPNNLQGTIKATIGAQSQGASCNEPFSFYFVR